MNNMDEILFWVRTRQAPCLMNFDNVIKKQNEPAYSSSRPKSVHSLCEEGDYSPKKKKKRKLSVLDGESTSPEKQKNLFFETPQQNKKAVISICRSDTADSDIDFNIKIPSVQYKSKRKRLKKDCRTTLHKKNQVFMSTPKVTALRRSRRRTQHINYNTEVNISFQPMNDISKSDEKHTRNKLKSSELLVNGNGGVNHVKQSTIEVQKAKTNQVVLNGQFEDLSDVSGFTANYIRSTKLHSTKVPRNLRNKSSRTLVKESQQSTKQGDNAVLDCVNKAVNTSKGTRTAALNCSTDSSQNILNFSTIKHKKNIAKKVDTSTSALKFMEARVQNKIDIEEMDDKINDKIGSLKVNIPFKRRSISRYPKRHKNTSNDLTTTDTSADQSPDKRRNLNIKLQSTLNDSDRKENPEESISRTRSGRPIGQRVREPWNSVLVVNNATEQASTVAVNVAVAMDKEQSAGDSGKRKKCRGSLGVKYVRRAADSSAPAPTSRDRSGFTQCFSDSDGDSEPLKQRKFFC